MAPDRFSVFQKRINQEQKTFGMSPFLIISLSLYTATGRLVKLGKSPAQMKTLRGRLLQNLCQETTSKNLNAVWHRFGKNVKPKAAGLMRKLFQGAKKT